MPSDFSAARVHLERAYDYLHGADTTSRKSREALDLLIEAAATAEYRRPTAKVVPFHRSVESRRDDPSF